MQLRPFNSPKETWAFQLTELFSLQDYPVPGYELPVVTVGICLLFCVDVSANSLVNQAALSSD